MLFSGRHIGLPLHKSSNHNHKRAVKNPQIFPALFPQGISVGWALAHQWERVKQWAKAHPTLPLLVYPSLGADRCVRPLK